MTVVGKSRAALVMICDALASHDTFRSLNIVNNLKIKDEFIYGKFQFKDIDLPQLPPYYLGAVMPETKKNLVDLFPVDYWTIKNRTAFIAHGSSIDVGCLIDSCSSVAGGSVIGKYVTLYANSSIAHNCNISDFVTICPGVAICGDVNIGEGTFIGAGSVVKNGIKIGKNCVIGCGSVVIKDVDDDKTIYGNPAK